MMRLKELKDFLLNDCEVRKMRRYLVVIPPHKPPYMVGFGEFEKAAEVVNLNVGMVAKIDEACFGTERAIMISAGSVSKKSRPVNERATYFASLPSAEDDIYGTAIVAADGEPNRLLGFAAPAAQKIIDEINGL